MPKKLLREDGVRFLRNNLDDDDDDNDPSGSPNTPGSSFNHFQSLYMPASSRRQGSRLLASLKDRRFFILLRISSTSHSATEEMRLLRKSRTSSLVSIWMPSGMDVKRLWASLSSFIGVVDEMEEDGW